MPGLGWYACTDAVLMTAETRSGRTHGRRPRSLGVCHARNVRTVAATRIRRSGGWGKASQWDVSLQGRRELDPCPGAPMLMDMSEHRARPSLEIRVTALEWEVRQLRAELIRAKTAGERPTSPLPPFAPAVEARLPTDPPPAPSETAGPSLEPRRSPAAPVAPGIDLETLVGRYGML